MILSIILAVVQFFASSLYIVDTLKGKTKPNRVSWLLWGIMPLIGATATNSDGFQWSTLPVMMMGIMPLLIFLSSFVNKNSYWKLSKLDYVCAGVAVLACILWQITDNPIIAISFSIVADGLAGLPTIIKAIKHPETETGTNYAIGFGVQLVNLFNVATWTFTEVAFPIYLVLHTAILTWACFRKRR